MQTLWGTRGRPETNAYAELCAEQQTRLRRGKIASLRVVEVVTPTSAAPKQAESKRTQDKWAAARQRAKEQGLVV